MTISSKSLKYLGLIALLTFTLQLSYTATSFGAGGTNDIKVVNSWGGYLGRAHITDVCNDGDEEISNFNITMTLSNFDVAKVLLLKPGQNAVANVGTINASTGLWTGSLLGGKCVTVAFVGEPTGLDGDPMIPSYHLSEGILAGGAANNDPDLSNNDILNGFEQATVVNVPDLKIDQRVLTSGAIDVGDNIDYEMTVSNIGLGASFDTSAIVLVFVVPTEVNFVGVDELAGPNNAPNSLELINCVDGGPTSNVGPGLAGYAGSIRICFLDPRGDFMPGESGKFKFRMQAAQGFGAGTKVVSLVSGDDADSLQQQVDIADGLDPLTNAQTNNSTDLIYDPTELTVTLSRCAGQGATTTTGNGCFNVTFNKDIYATSFTQNVLVLTGGGSVSGFTQIDARTWRVDVTGITPGSTLTLTLLPDTVQDNSAVKNGVQVLGENTIRYEAPGSNSVVEPTTPTPGLENEKIVKASIQTARTATGVLSATGMHMSETITAIWLCGLGLIMAVFSRRKRPFCRY